ncbi:MAG TPA: hypothetical protein DDW87_09095, partial [Firmicutes bacterium]|nr:hypothetical protein [Bacillota bacterium]
MRHTIRTNTITILVCIVLMLVTSTASLGAGVIDFVNELSSSNYAGRLTGTPGNELASHYIATQFSRLGLEPLGGLDDYYQQYTQPTRFLHGLPELAIVADQGVRREPLHYLKDFIVAVGLGLTNEGRVEKPGVILQAAAHLSPGASELPDLRESILLIPEHVFLPNQNAIMHHLTTTSSKPAGIILEADIGDQFFPAPLFINPAERETPAQLPLLFSAKSDVFQESVEAVENGLKLRMVADFELTETKANNVLGIIPGNLEEGSENKHEYVIIGAHFDGAGPNMAGPNPGAHDNASGVAVLLECAARLKSDKISLEPTMVFVA